MTQRIILAGNAVTAQILHSYLASDARYELVGLTVSDEYVSSGRLAGVESVPISRAKQAFSPDDCRVVMAIGYDNLNRVREAVFLQLKSMGYTVETYVHPHARVHTANPLGEGCVVLPGAVIEPYATVGANTAVWTNVTLAHHCSVAEHCWIAAGTVVSGQARVLRNTFLGVNSTIVNDVTVSQYTIVGAAAMVSKDTKPHTVHLARSAEPFRFSSDDYVRNFKF
jgi:sugar O-acyltransferase (sialic acid O-acetyltransferase NeuD family)